MFKPHIASQEQTRYGKPFICRSDSLGKHGFSLLVLLEGSPFKKPWMIGTHQVQPRSERTIRKHYEFIPQTLKSLHFVPWISSSLSWWPQHQVGPHQLAQTWTRRGGRVGAPKLLESWPKMIDCCWFSGMFLGRWWYSTRVSVIKSLAERFAVIHNLDTVAEA